MKKLMVGLVILVGLGQAGCEFIGRSGGRGRRDRRRIRIPGPSADAAARGGL